MIFVNKPYGPKYFSAYLGKGIVSLPEKVMGRRDRGFSESNVILCHLGSNNAVICASKIKILSIQAL